jgi:hypothetical protein
VFRNQYVRHPVAILCIGTVVAIGLSACSTISAANPKTSQPPIPATSQAPSVSHRAFLSSLGTPTQIASTVPPNGDVNPYGVAIVPSTVGKLTAGDVLVSNFNDKANVQGTGTTLVEISPGGRLSAFASIKTSSLSSSQICPGGIGLSTALAILPGDWVVVGSAPADPSGAPANVNPNGCLVVLDPAGKVTETWSNPDINGPWDLTASVSGTTAAIFVSNVLSRPANATTTPVTGVCTVARLEVSLAGGVPQMIGENVIGSDFAWRVNHSTFMLGPTGLALGSNGSLYVAQALGNRITLIPDALTRTSPVADGTSTLTSGGFLNAPLGMTIAPNGDVIAMNGNDGNAVEVTPQGHQIAKVTLVKDGAGTLFGVAITSDGRLVFVNDGSNSLDVAS